jgi:hypothetical protein
MAARPNETPKKDNDEKKRDLNQKPLTVEQRKHRIAELYRLKMKFEEWYIAANGKDLESQTKAKVLNGVILYIKNRIEYLSTQMQPVLENPSHTKKDSESSSATSQRSGPVEKENKE